MRRLVLVCVAVATALLSGMAWAGNQETADQIANSLKKSGQLSDYRISVKFQDGTVWLQGRVSSQEQMNRALGIVVQTPGVKRVVPELTISTSQAAQSEKNENRTVSTAKKLSASNPLRGVSDGRLVQPMSATETTSSMPAPAKRSATRVAMTQAPAKLQPIPPAPAAPMPTPPEAGMPAGAVPVNGAPLPMHATGVGGGPAPVRYDQPCMPNYAWPSYAAYPNYAAVTYPKQYSPTAWPYIGPFYPYPQVPLGWRKVTLEWHDGWWQLDFKDEPTCKWWR